MTAPLALLTVEEIAEVESLARMNRSSIARDTTLRLCATARVGARAVETMRVVDKAHSSDARTILVPFNELVHSLCCEWERRLAATTEERGKK